MCVLAKHVAEHCNFLFWHLSYRVFMLHQFQISCHIIQSYGLDIYWWATLVVSDICSIIHSGTSMAGIVPYWYSACLEITDTSLYRFEFSEHKIFFVLLEADWSSIIPHKCHLVPILVSALGCLFHHYNWVLLCRPIQGALLVPILVSALGVFLHHNWVLLGRPIQGANTSDSTECLSPLGTVVFIQF